MLEQLPKVCAGWLRTPDCEQIFVGKGSFVPGYFPGTKRRVELERCSNAQWRIEAADRSSCLTLRPNSASSARCGCGSRRILILTPTPEISRLSVVRQAFLNVGRPN